MLQLFNRDEISEAPVWAETSRRSPSNCSASCARYLINCYHFNCLRLGAPQGQMIAAHAHLNGIAERGCFDHANRRARHDAHLQQSPRDWSLAVNGHDPRRDAVRKSVKR